MLIKPPEPQLPNENREQKKQRHHANNAKLYTVPCYRNLSLELWECAQIEEFSESHSDGHRMKVVVLVQRCNAGCNSRTELYQEIVLAGCKACTELSQEIVLAG